MIMWCLVSLPNCVNLDVKVDPKGKGQECLDQVCVKLGIVEKDYFGLQYHCPRGEILWLNMRNSIRQQVPGPNPCRLFLRVKFFVPPHLLLQETTRHLFYLHVKHDLEKGHFRLSNEEAAHLLAFVAQAEFEDCSMHDDASMCHHTSQDLSRYSSLIVGRDADLSYWHTVCELHHKLKGWSRTKAEYWLLKEASSLKSYGEEVFQAKTHCGENVLLGVGQEGVTIYGGETAEIIQSISYPCIQMATHTGKCFFLNCITDSETLNLEYKLEATKTANGLYRAVTEKHAFYSCETVRRSVTTQFIRDLKGTIVSLFNENTALGKNYVFDVRLTCREVYDNARRTLYEASRSGRQSLSEDDPMEESISTRSCNTIELMSDRENDFIDCESENEDVHCQKASCAVIRGRLSSIEDAMLCRVCMDADIDTAFFPCGHVSCCNHCAVLCERCPLCRSTIEQSHFVYLPFLDTERTS